MENETKIKVFCAGEQKETDYNLDIDGNGEIVLTCTSNVGTEEEPKVCGRFLKYPKGTDATKLKVLLEKHKEVNEGDVLAEDIEKQKAELLNGFKSEEV